MDRTDALLALFTTFSGMSSGGVQGDHLSRYTDNDTKFKPLHHQKPAIAYTRCWGQLIVNIRTWKTLFNHISQIWKMLFLKIFFNQTIN
jgi:hypothetical protein